MTQKTMLVTGSNKGIGFEIVRQLAELGHRVILTARDETRGRVAMEKVKGDIHFLLLDIIDENSIRLAASKAKAEFGKIEVLINNAAILLKEDYSLLTSAAPVIEKTIHANAVSQLAVTRAFHPLIPDGGRIIMTSSGGGSMSDPVGGWSPAYCVAKSLLGAMTRHLAHELVSRKIAVNAFDPGWVKTDMGGKSAPRNVEQGADTAIWLATGERTDTGKFFRDKRVIPW